MIAAYDDEIFSSSSPLRIAVQRGMIRTMKANAPYAFWRARRADVSSRIMNVFHFRAWCKYNFID